MTTLHKSIEFYYITDGFSKEFGQEIKIYQVCSKETKRLSKSQVNSAWNNGVYQNKSRFNMVIISQFKSV